MCAAAPRRPRAMTDRNQGPTWVEVRDQIPPCFKYQRELSKPHPPGNHNGASSPFRFLYPVIYDKRTRDDIEEASYIHDFGYMFARLPGSGMDHLTRYAWDSIYRDWYLAHEHPAIARLHFAGVRIGGGGAWLRNGEMMQKWGLYTYQDYLDSKRPTPPSAGTC